MVFSSVLAFVLAFAAQTLAVPTSPPLVPSSTGGGVAIPTPAPTGSGGSPWWLPPSSSVPPTVNICAAVSKAVPLQRAYIGGATSAADHFYTADGGEMALAVSRHGYKQEAHVGKVHTSQEPGTVPLYRTFNEPASDHYYTNSTQERDNALTLYGYQDEGIAAYIYVDGRCGGIPLYMLFSASASDHFYTTLEAEANASGYQRERIVGYVLPL